MAKVISNNNSSSHFLTFIIYTALNKILLNPFDNPIIHYFPAITEEKSNHQKHSALASDWKWTKFWPEPRISNLRLVLFCLFSQHITPEDNSTAAGLVLHSHTRDSHHHPWILCHSLLGVPAVGASRGSGTASSWPKSKTQLPPRESSTALGLNCAEVTEFLSDSFCHSALHRTQASWKMECGVFVDG